MFRSDSNSRRSRRAVLAGALGGVAAAVAGAISRPTSVLAATDDGKTIHVGDQYSNVTAVTSLSNKTTGTIVLLVRSQMGGIAVAGDSIAGDSPAIRGQGHIGVEGVGTTGVYGFSVLANGRGVQGDATRETTETYGVVGTAVSPLGRGVFGWDLAASGGTGVWGQTDNGTGVAVRGYAWDGGASTGKFGTAVMGTSGSHAFPPPAPLANTGVYGIGYGGRGGVFAGSVAQLRLSPWAAAHPGVGAVGDFFVSTTGDLWFCKGGSTWVKLA